MHPQIYVVYSFMYKKKTGREGGREGGREREREGERDKNRQTAREIESHKQVRGFALKTSNHIITDFEIVFQNTAVKF